MVKIKAFSELEPEANFMKELLQLREETVKGIEDSNIVQSVLDGSLSADVYKKYLLNVWHYAVHSSKVIGLAGSRAVNSHPELAEYLFRHAQEELGHDEWVLEDLKNLGCSEEDVRKSRATPSCAAMIGYEYFLAGTTNPIAIFGWLYILEAMGDDLGTEVATKISQKDEFKNSLKFLAGHGIADEEHTKDLTEMISKYVKGQDYEDVVHTAEVIQKLYVGMFKELS